MDAAMVTYVSDRLPVERLVSALVAAGFEVGRPRSVRRTLLDTFDGRLAAAGVRLEARAGTGLDLVVRGDGPPAVHRGDGAVPSVAADLPPGPLQARLGPLLDVRALLPKLTVTTRETTAVRRNGSGKAVAGVVVHDGLTLESGDALPLPWAAELASFEGYARPSREADGLLRSLGLQRRDGAVLDVVADAAGIDLRGFVDSPTVALEVSEPAIEGFRRVLANLADTVDANWQGTVDDVDPEFLHDLRIAVRRTRSVLSHGKQVLPADARGHFGTEFRWLGDVTSPPRDLDVYVIEWPGYVAPLGPDAAAALAPVVEHIEGRRQAAYATLAEHLRSGRYRGTMAGWRAWLKSPLADAALAKRSTRPLGPVVATRLVDAQDRLLARGRAIDTTTPAEELHELRKDAKRLRYLLECFGGLLPGTVRKPFVSRLKALQDNLGEHQDTEVHTAQLRTMSDELHGSPGVTADTLLAMGRLTELFERRRQAARAEFAERFASYDSKPAARAFDQLLDAAGTG